LATSLIVAGWTYFILTGNISTIWPMFGIANQLLACAALCVGTTIILRESAKKSYAWITLAPLCFVSVTTITAGIESVLTIYYPMSQVAATHITGLVNLIVTVVLLFGVCFIIIGSVARWLTLLKSQSPAPPNQGIHRQAGRLMASSQLSWLPKRSLLCRSCCSDSR